MGQNYCEYLFWNNFIYLRVIHFQIITGSIIIRNMKSIFSNFGKKFAGAQDPVLKGIVSPMRSVPSHIKGPEYATSGMPREAPNAIITYNKDHIADIRKSARLARKMLEFALSLAKPGVTTEEIDIATHAEIVKHGAYPSPINYRGFPKAICTSPNEVVCHGIPDSRALKDGDVLSIDVSLFMNGYHGDNCGTVIVGKPKDEESVRLVSTAKQALMDGIQTCKPGR